MVGVFPSRMVIVLSTQGRLSFDKSCQPCANQQDWAVILTGCLSWSESLLVLCRCNNSLLVTSQASFLAAALGVSLQTTFPILWQGLPHLSGRYLVWWGRFKFKSSSLGRSFCSTLIVSQPILCSVFLCLSKGRAQKQSSTTMSYAGCIVHIWQNAGTSKHPDCKKWAAL